MVDHSVESNGIRKMPPNLHTIPQELRDQILQETLQKGGIIAFDKEGFIGTRGRDAITCYYGLVCSCKQLRQEIIPIFIKNNTFRLWAQEKTPTISDMCSRLLRSLDIIAVVVVGGRLRHVIACIKVRGATVAMTVDGKTWKGSEDGTEEVTGALEQEHRASDMFDRLIPSLKMLHKTLQGGHGISIETLKKVQRQMDRAS